MVSRGRIETFPYTPHLVLAYAGLVWVLLANQSLPFPLGAEDQYRIIAAIHPESRFAPPGDSWITGPVDRIFVPLNRQNPFPLISFLRRCFLTGAIVGLAIGCVRNCGRLVGSWVAVLSLGYLPIRVLAGTLAPQSLTLFFLVWGMFLSLGRPWSKTGTVEQFAGGGLLGFGCFASPWGFLYCGAVPLQTLFSLLTEKKKRKRGATGTKHPDPNAIPPVRPYRLRRLVETPFWTGFLLGVLPGILWILSTTPSFEVLLGLHMAGLQQEKLPHVATLVGEFWGWGFIAAAGIGFAVCWKRPEEDWHHWAILFSWPLIPSLILGYETPETAALAFPGLLLLFSAFLQRVGRIFVSRTESKLIPSLLALMAGYHLFFSGLPTVRERQAYSREVASLAQLIVAHVPPGDPVALFRLNPLIDYLHALHPRTHWGVLKTDQFPQNPKYLGFVVRERFGRVKGVWIDPKRILEPETGLSPEYLQQLENSFLTERFAGKDAAELLRIGIP